MQFGIASRLLWSYPLYDVIAIAERLHYDGVEIWAEHYTRDRGRKSRLAFSKSSLIFALHAFSFDVNITSMNRRIRRECMRQMFDSLQYASEIGARCVVVHPGRTSSAKDSPDEYWAMQVDSLSEIVLKAKERGMDVNMEIMEPRKKEIVTTPEIANEILQAIPMENFGITLDLSHAQLTGSPLEFIRRLEKISHIHLSDAREGTPHCLLGEGDLDVCGILRELRRRYDGLVIIEGWNRQDELGMVKKTTERVNEIRSEFQGKDHVGGKGVKSSRMRSVRSFLAKYSISPTKRLGQHFLMDKDIMAAIIGTAEVNSQDVVLEVGPGLGEMTKLLALKAKSVIAIELDESMVALLKDRLADCENIELLRGDALKFDFLRESRKWGEKLKVVSNLPYNIATQLLFRFVEMREALSGMTLMLQREVAERIVAIPGGKQYGALSVLLQLYCDPSIRLIVPPSSFYPRPKVESAVVRFDFLKKPRVEIEDEPFFRKVVKASFGHRRKTLKNALKNVTFFSVKGEEIEQYLRKAGIDPWRRGETLTLQEFATLSEELSKAMTSGRDSPEGNSGR